MIKRNKPFVCDYCGVKVQPAEKGKCRNHCHGCLWSKHVDITPGDRKHRCKGLMQPIKLEKRKGKMYIQHQCQKCGILKWNKLLEDDKIEFDKSKFQTQDENTSRTKKKI